MLPWQYQTLNKNVNILTINFERNKRHNYYNFYNYTSQRDRQLNFSKPFSITRNTLVRLYTFYFFWEFHLLLSWSWYFHWNHQEILVLISFWACGLAADQNVIKISDFCLMSGLSVRGELVQVWGGNQTLNHRRDWGLIFIGWDVSSLGELNPYWIVFKSRRESNFSV